MGVAIITDLNLSVLNLGKVEFVEDVALESLTITKGATSNNEVPFYVAYTPERTKQRGVTWSVTGSQYVSINASTGVLTIEEGAVNVNITVRATSTVNPSISATLETTVSYDDTPITFVSGAVKSVLLSSFDSDNDGEITRSEASAKAFTIELKEFKTAAPFNEFRYFQGTTEIAKNAFASSRISEITLPSTITLLQPSSFESMPNLIRLVLPEGVTSIAATAIRSNAKLAFVDLPSTLTSIGYRGVVLIASKAVLICRASTPPASSLDLPADAKIYVPDNSVDIYKAANGWSTFASIIYPLSEYKD